MKKIAYLMIFGAAQLQAADVDLGSISVESTTLSDVSGEEIKSADVAEALHKKVPSVSLVRRSGIANDIILRGQKKDNINVLIDNTMIYGACPNRMDPTTSHVLANNIESIEIIEGPYDVENFGTLSGAVKVTTLEPSKELSGEVSLNVGSWGYQKAAAQFSGGTDKVKFLLSASKEKSGQYEDGDGNTFADQIENYTAAAGPRYKDKYRDMDAYDKKTFMGKLYVDVAKDQQLKLSYTANRSDDVLYPSSPMDALWDDSDIINLEYSINNIGRYSKALDIQAYDSRVDHPMSNYYRNSSGTDSVNEKIHDLTTHMQGVKIKNTFDIDSSNQLMIGLDTSNRNWDGHFKGEGSQSLLDGMTSLDDVDTKNMALFAELETRHSDTVIKAGMRYDDTHIETAGTMGQPENDYKSLSANIFANHQLNNSIRVFGGIGRANRVPDARELYLRMAMVNASPPPPVMRPWIGTPDLEQTTNTEIDLGVEKDYQSGSVKAKLFHSRLEDYIYYNSSKMMNRFENINATIYGMELSGIHAMSDELYLDYGLAYLRGTKDEALEGQTDKDLAEIPPLKLNMALNYDYGLKNTASVELVAADDWSNFDADNGEQALDGYAIVNLKVKHMVTEKVELTAGVDNVFNKTYAVSNTYSDLTLLTGGATDVMLMNEPGRYLYVNGTYRF